MNILIVEDEELTARKLQRFVEQVEPTANVVGITGSVEETVTWLRQNGAGQSITPALLLMDIELADGQSFAIFNQVTVNCPVIFTTAYDEFAIQAFKVNSIDYLLKPVKVDDLRRAFAKLQALQTILAPQRAQIAQLLAYLTSQSVSTNQLISPVHSNLVSDSQQHPFRERFLVKQGQRLIPVSVDEIAYFYSRNRLSFIKTYDEHDWMVDYTMDELADMIDPARFFRLNRQIIAELRSIEKVHLHFNGKLKINLRPLFEDEVMVSRDKAGEFKVWLGE
jgi:two-component system LytT family response regulator